ncbi:MAG TPA: alpha/beta fold hydrolase, partial [Gammaproteobacteria bacterium]|nr:alpha/beta fold hydrolase [Gammaproteobacteria bacterium]
MRYSESRSAVWALLCLLCLLAAAAARSQEPEKLLSEPLAEAFGSAPLVRGLRLSPDGSRISFVQMHPDGYPLVNVFDTRSGKITTAMAGVRDGYDISWCDWANEERLLCSLRFIEPTRGVLFPHARLAAVNADGSKPLLLLQQDRTLRTTQYQDNIIDWLRDDPEHVLLGLRISPYEIGNGLITAGHRSTSLTGPHVVRLNIYDSKVESVISADDEALDWITDGHGTPSLRLEISPTQRTWYVLDPESGWSILHQTPLTDVKDEFSPIAFDRDANEVLFLDRYEGHTALYALALGENRVRRLVYANPRVDVAGVYRVGRYERVVAAVTIEDRPVLNFFEPGIQRVHEMLAAEFPGMAVNVIDEDWAERRYLVFVNSDRDPGTYYIFDSQARELKRFARAFPALGERELAVVQPITYPAADGTEIPAYLTLPPKGASGAAVVLPHGGPSSRDYWRFDFLVQFLAARGYAVLQSNYRGSAGYGEDWAGSGGFQDWRQAVGDISDGARYLVKAGIAEPGRLCVVGWSYGGYAALLSAIEHASLYRCVVSIAGVTDPVGIERNAGNFVGGRSAQAFIGRDDEVREQGSPLRRAAEIGLPTLLFHAHQDVNVPFDQSLELRDAMRREGGDVELIEYEHAEHNISPARYRIDMLARLGNFLSAHLDAPVPNFYSSTAPAANAVEILDFGADSSRPDGRCSDPRFLAPDGSVLTDAPGHVSSKTHGDATDCRRLFMSGTIVLKASFAPNRAGNLAAETRATLFVDPAEQAGVGIVS